MLIRLFFMIFLILMLGCFQHQEQIIPKERLITNNGCLNQSKGCYNRFGYCISNYFEFTAIEAKDLDNNGIIDSIAQLSPLELLPEFEFCHKQENKKIENRLLLINLMNADGTILKKFKYDNVISNKPTYPIHQGGEYINTSEEHSGFVLFQDYGQGCYTQYYIYISYLMEKNDFIVDSIIFKSACPIDTIENIEKYDIKQYPFYLKSYNRSIIDDGPKKK